MQSENQEAEKAASRVQRVIPARDSACKAAILGFGTVGSSVARILLDLKPGDIELTHIFNRGVQRKRAEWVPDAVAWTDDFEEVLSSDVDLMVELVGGLKPAGDWVERALLAGKSVITANKQLIAYRGVELEALARKSGGHLFYGAAVAGGIPVIPGLQQGLAGDELRSLSGILNGTCNFILSRMEAGAQYEDVLKEAQQLGYAEADPTADVGGFDARAKLVILTRIGLRAEVLPDAVLCQTIADIAAIDFLYAKELNCTIRQISRAEVSTDEQGRLEVRAVVGPMLVPLSSPLAWSRGTENMVIANGKYGGDTVFSGHGAGGDPTAVAVVSDMLSAVHGANAVELPSVKAKVKQDFHVPHYIRLVVNDRPGIIAEIAGDLAQSGINIHAILQKPGYAKDWLPFVVIVEPCSTASLVEALERMKKMDCLLGDPLCLQMLD